MDGSDDELGFGIVPDDIDEVGSTRLPGISALKTKLNAIESPDHSINANYTQIKA